MFLCDGDNTKNWAMRPWLLQPKLPVTASFRFITETQLSIHTTLFWKVAACVKLPQFMEIE